MSKSTVMDHVKNAKVIFGEIANEDYGNLREIFARRYLQMSQ